MPAILRDNFDINLAVAWDSHNNNSKEENEPISKVKLDFVCRGGEKRTSFASWWCAAEAWGRGGRPCIANYQPTISSLLVYSFVAKKLFRSARCKQPSTHVVEKVYVLCIWMAFSFLEQLLERVVCLSGRSGEQMKKVSAGSKPIQVLKIPRTNVLVIRVKVSSLILIVSCSWSAAWIFMKRVGVQSFSCRRGPRAV